MGNPGVYIHIPFCIRKCPYCDFYSEAVDGLSGKFSLEDAFIKSLTAEIKAVNNNGKIRHIDSIYFGGGTPSILKPESISEILSAVHDSFDVDKNSEVTIEVNPKTASLEKFKAYRDMGINRISIGSQSFDDKVLKILGRVHNVSDTFETIEMAEKSGFNNVSLDLMFAIPGQSFESFTESVKTAESLADHISFYSLEFMEGTPFTKALNEGRLTETDVSEDRKMYEWAAGFLTGKGFIHYEISNMAKPGFEARHNSKYWNLDEYYGFGPSASSYVDHKRITNERNLNSYIKGGGISHKREIIENTPFDDMSEFTFTGLRRGVGISKSEFKRRFGIDFWDHFSEAKSELDIFKSEGFVTEDSDTLALTLKGFSISNKIMSLFV